LVLGETKKTWGKRQKTRFRNKMGCKSIQRGVSKRKNSVLVCQPCRRKIRAQGVKTRGIKGQKKWKKLQKGRLKKVGGGGVLGSINTAHKKRKFPGGWGGVHERSRPQRRKKKEIKKNTDWVNPKKKRSGPKSHLKPLGKSTSANVGEKREWEEHHKMKPKFPTKNRCKLTKFINQGVNAWWLRGLGEMQNEGRGKRDVKKKKKSR